MKGRPVLTQEEANAVYDVLVLHCGASETGRGDFVYTQIDDHIEEYRFCGSLGFGGKFRRYTGNRRPDGTWGEHWTVNQYREDQTPESAAAIAAAEPLLDALRVAHEQRLADTLTTGD